MLFSIIDLIKCSVYELYTITFHLLKNPQKDSYLTVDTMQNLLSVQEALFLVVGGLGCPEDPQLVHPTTSI